VGDLPEAIEKLRSQILQDAREKAKQIIEEAEGEAKKLIEQTEADAKDEAQKNIAAAKTEAEGTRKRLLSNETKMNRWRTLEEKNRLVNKVLEEARVRVKEITETKKYEHILEKLIADAMKALEAESYTVKLTGRDRKRFEPSKLEQNVKKLLNKNVKLKWSQENIEALGGAVVGVEGKKVWLDNTLDTRFERLQDKLVFQIAKILFSN